MVNQLEMSKTTLTVGITLLNTVRFIKMSFPHHRLADTDYLTSHIAATAIKFMTSHTTRKYHDTLKTLAMASTQDPSSHVHPTAVSSIAPFPPPSSHHSQSSSKAS
jgi:hypothetical protein